MTVLVISCPHALGLAIPLTTSLSSAMAARNGILVKDRLALEESRTVDAFLFDKTGTLTKGQHTVVGVAGVGDRRGRGAAPRRRRRVRQRAPAGPGHRRRRQGARRRRRGHRLPVDHRPRRRSRPSTAAATPSAARRCCASGTLAEPAELADWSQGWKERGAAVLYLVRRRRDHRRPGPRGRGPPRGPRRRRRAPGHGTPGRDDHRRRPPGRRRRRRATSASTRCSPRCSPRTRPAKVAELQARGLQGRHGRRRRQRRPGAGQRRRRHRHRRRHRRRHRVRRADPRQLRPPSWSSASSGCRRPPTARASRTCGGPPGTTSSPSPSPPARSAWAGVSMPPAVAAILMSVVDHRRRGQRPAAAPGRPATRATRRGLDHPNSRRHATEEDNR